MSRAEEGHWWYKGLRDVLERTLRRRARELHPNPRILDAGCGTGGNLACLRDLLRPSYMAGFDVSEEALSFTSRKVPEAELFVSDICDPRLSMGELDLVTSLDVIYIPGSRRAQAGLRSLVGALRSGGYLVVNLPSYNWLYSDHDVAIHTTERFTASRVRALLEESGLEVDLLSYRICFLFPAVVLRRLPSLVRGPAGKDVARSDLHDLPGDLANRILYSVVQAENAVIDRGIALPFGSSVFAIGRKP